MIANGKERRARIKELEREVKKLEPVAADIRWKYMTILKSELFALREVERIARGTWGKA